MKLIPQKIELLRKIILTLTVFDWPTCWPCDRRTEGRSDGLAIAHGALCMLSRIVFNQPFILLKKAIYKFCNKNKIFQWSSKIINILRAVFFTYLNFNIGEGQCAAADCCADNGPVIALVPENIYRRRSRLYILCSHIERSVHQNRIDPYNFELYRFKVGGFCCFVTQCRPEH